MYLKVLKGNEKWFHGKDEAVFEQLQNNVEKWEFYLSSFFLFLGPRGPDEFFHGGKKDGWRNDRWSSQSQIRNGIHCPYIIVYNYTL